jgi:DNA-binding MarR family transcriptional regulator
LFLGREDVSVFALSPDEAALARSILAKLVGGRADADPTTLAMRGEQTALDLARSIHFARKRRAEHFGAALFSEPAWDMLLILFIYGDRSGEPLSVTRLAEYGDAPLTTAIRWLDYLESQRMIIRQQSGSDRRKNFVELSEHGRTMLINYFESLLSNSKE